MLLPARLNPGQTVTEVAPGGFPAALRDPSVRAIAVAGSHRLIDDLDSEAVRADPKAIVGTGGTTFLHLALWQQCELVGIHGDEADLSSAEPVRVRAGDDGPVRVPGRASGPLLGGSLGALRALVGTGLLPDFDGAILLLTGERTQGLGQVDRQLTHLIRAGLLDRVRGVAVGRFAGFGKLVDREWTVGDVLADRLGGLGVPVLSGLPIGPGGTAVAIGVPAELDAGRGELLVAAGVR